MNWLLKVVHLWLRGAGRLFKWAFRSRVLLSIGASCLIAIFFLSWTSFRESSLTPSRASLIRQLEELEHAVDRHNALEQRLKQLLLLRPRTPLSKLIIPVLVVACNRPSVKRTVDALLKHRSNLFHLSPSQFPITVSQGCEHKPTADTLAAYGTAISVIHFDYNSEEPPKKPLTVAQKSYRSMTHHYKFALDHMLFKGNHQALIVVEDDLDIAPDFFEYFAATFPVLSNDPTLFCVSAWNDNGRPGLINEQRTDLIYRTDFFPGLGWMLLREFWLEIRDNWPDIYWDEYIRQAYVRRNRACLRPEIGRTTTFGRLGTSQGQYFDKYLRTMQLNGAKFNFLEANLTYLTEPGYTERWKWMVYEQAIPISIDDLLKDRLPNANELLRVTYTKPEEFDAIARHFTLMSDLKSGVSRTAFRGVVPVFWKNHQIFIAPPSDWNGYVVS